MKTTLKYGWVVILVICCNLQSNGQYTFFKNEKGFAIEVSLPNTKLVRLPIYQNSITSLAVTGDQITGGTSAEEKLSPYIFSASFSKREMTEKKDLESIIPGQRAIGTGFSKGKNNILYAGTLANRTDGSKNGTGHLIQVQTGGSLQVSDLGSPVAGEGIFALTCDSSRGTLYGLTYPSGIFFTYDIASKQSRQYNNTRITPEEIDSLHEYSVKPENYLSRALAVDNNGIVYGSQTINRMFAFDPSTSTFKILISPLPEVWGRRTLGQADAFAKSSDGKIYGGNAGDGQVFELNTSTGKIKNLGKPVMMNRIRGLTFGADGKLYGIAGAPPGYAHLFSYDPANEGFYDYGNPQFIMKAPGIEQGIEWRGFRLGSIAATEDGKYIVLGEDESLSQLLIFPVENE